MLKGLGWSLTQIVCYVIGFLRMVCTSLCAIRKSGKCGELATWLKSPTDFSKLNVDASFRDDSKEVGWGLIARDADGDILCATVGHLTAQSGALQAEATTLLHAIQFAEIQGVRCVIFKTNSVVLQQSVTSTSPTGLHWGCFSFKPNTCSSQVSQRPKSCTGQELVINQCMCWRTLVAAVHWEPGLLVSGPPAGCNLGCDRQLC